MTLLTLSGASLLDYGLKTKCRVSPCPTPNEMALRRLRAGRCHPNQKTIENERDALVLAVRSSSSLNGKNKKQSEARCLSVFFKLTFKWM